MLALSLYYGIDFFGYASGPDGILAHEPDVLGIRHRRRASVLGLRRLQGSVVEVLMLAEKPSGQIA